MSDTVTAFSIGGATGAVMLLADVVAGGAITTATIKDVAPVIIAVGSIAVWIGRKFQRLEDIAEETKTRLTAIEKRCDESKCMVPDSKHKRQ